MKTDIRFPARPGAYVLVIDLARPLRFQVAGGNTVFLPAGRYAYCGSARGPGGLAARLARHMRLPKPVHWHVDHLTAAGRVAAVGITREDDECALFDKIARLPGVGVPAPGLGSSDCRRCAAHLAAVDAAFGPAAIGLVDVLVA